MSSKQASGNLFSEFDPVTKEQWIGKANADLKGADFSKKLMWRTLEGFEVQPFYMKEDLENLDYLKTYNNSVINKDRLNAEPRHWINQEKILVKSEKEISDRVHEALHSGADSIEFDLTGFTGDPSPQILLNHINPAMTPVSFSGLKTPSTFLKDLLSYQKIDPEDITGSMNFDPAKDLSITGQIDPGCWNELEELLRLCLPAKDFRAITVNGGHIINAGGNAVQEIAFALNAVVDYIEKLSENGFSAEEIISNIQVSMGIGTNYFMEIAKLRALRILFNQISVESGYKKHQPEALIIHSHSSIWSKTIFDPYVNMLRNTTEAMSAVLGGCNILSIDPFDSSFSDPSGFSQRISRNISTILKEESYFNKVVDPAAGSYYIETLTDQLVNNSWELFKEIESAGGYIKAFQNGIISEKIKKIRDKKLNLTGQRREVFIGTNQYPNPAESLEPPKIKFTNKRETDNNILPRHGGAIDFEELRLLTDDYVLKNGEESRPLVYLALIGDNKIMRKARATFSAGFMGCAGYKVTEGSPSESIEEAVKKAITSKASITVICGSDDDYISSGVEFAKGYKENSNGLLVLAGYPSDMIDKLKSAGVDEFIHLRVNAFEVLSSFQEKLNIK
jgi:methylmalonyl-CoA mutase